jgi:DNA-binding transcriptional MerR regulator
MLNPENSVSLMHEPGGTAMRIQYFRISDIATRTAIPESRLCRYLDTFDEFFTYGDDGEERLYTPDVLYLIETISGLEADGRSDDEIRRILDERFPQLREQDDPEPKETGCPDTP